MASTTNYFPNGLPFELTLEITKVSQAADLQTLSITTKSMETFLLPVLKKWASEPDVIEDGAVPKLHHAAERANRWLLTKLTDNGASIHIRNPNGAMETALHRAVMSGNHDVVVFLLMHGAEASMQDSYGSTALHTAVQFMSLNEALIDELLDQAQNLSLKDDINGWTVIHHAIQGGNTDLVELLLARDVAQLEVADNHHRTPLLLAVQNSEVEIARLLLEAGANINAMTGGDEVRVHKAIWWAEYERCNEMAALLKEYETTVD